MLALLFAAPRYLRDGILILGAVVALGGMAFAQQAAPDPVARFGQEWSSLDSSINAAALQRQHVVEAAKAMIEGEQKNQLELDYWRRWIAGEQESWAPKAAAETKP